MKVQKTKDGKLKMKVRRSEPIINDWKNPNSEAKANREFGKNLRKSGEKTPNFTQVSERKYIRQD